MALRAWAGGTFWTMAVAATALMVAIGLLQPSSERVVFVALGAVAAPTGLRAGDVAPNFRLKTADGQRAIELGDFRGKKPVALIFGSFTWPPFRRQVGALNALYEKYGGDVEFCLIYVREAHPNDGMLDFFNHENLREGIDIAAHRSEAERAAAALGMCRKLALEMPTLIDDVQNTTGINYSAMPDRLFLVGRDGRIAYRGRRGPDGFEPEELEAAIQSELATIAGASDRPPQPQSLSSSPPSEPHPKLRPTS